MQTKPTEVIGIDISKLTLDAHLHLAGRHICVPNNRKGFAELVKWIKAETGLRSLRKVLAVMEATGLYSHQLEQFLHAKAVPFVKRAPLEIKNSAGIKRGKTDKADARAIATYGWEKWENLSPDVPAGDYHIQLRNLLAYRELMVTQCTAQKVFLSETATQVGPEFSAFIAQDGQAGLETLALRIKVTEAEIKALISSIKELSANYKSG